MIWEARLYRHLALVGYDFEWQYPAVEQEEHEVVGATRTVVTAHWHGRRLLLEWPGKIKFDHVPHMKRMEGFGLVRDAFLEVAIPLDGRDWSAGGGITVEMEDGLLVTVRSYADRGDSVGDALHVEEK